MNLRLCINVTDYVTPYGFDVYDKIDTANYDGDKGLATVCTILDGCAQLGANQVTFRKMWSAPGTPEDQWIKEHTKIAETILGSVETAVKLNGSLINILPYGAARYDYQGFSIVIDTDSMGKDKDNAATKYYIIREDGKMYSSWDSPASIIF